MSKAYYVGDRQSPNKTRMQDETQHEEEPKFTRFANVPTAMGAGYQNLQLDNGYVNSRAQERNITF